MWYNVIGLGGINMFLYIDPIVKLLDGQGEEMPLMLSGNIKKTADMEFTLTVKEDNYFNFKYKEFVLVDKATITN